MKNMHVKYSGAQRNGTVVTKLRTAIFQIVKKKNMIQNDLILLGRNALMVKLQNDGQKYYSSYL